MQLRFGPITAEPCRAKVCPLRPRRSYFAPAGVAPQSSLSRGPAPSLEWEPRKLSYTGGGAGYCPRVRKVYYDARLSPYPALAGRHAQYRRAAVKKIGRAFSSPKAPQRRVSRETNSYLEDFIPVTHGWSDQEQARRTRRTSRTSANSGSTKRSSRAGVLDEAEQAKTHRAMCELHEERRIISNARFLRPVGI